MQVESSTFPKQETAEDDIVLSNYQGPLLARLFSLNLILLHRALGFEILCVGVEVLIGIYF